MPSYNKDCNTIRSGKINGNPSCGLTDRVCVEVRRVYDGCVSRFASTNFQLVLTDMTAGLTPPYTFLSAVTSGAATITGQTSTPIDNTHSRFVYDVHIPMTITYSDSTGAIGTATSTINMHRDIILSIPARSLIPYDLSVTASAASEIGTFINDTTVNIVCCVIIMSKIIVSSDILVPSYGFAIYPDCIEGTEDLCSALLNLPLFPPFNP